MQQALSISELAKSAGVTARTLCHWERLGLLPKATRTHTGYRVFDPQTTHYVDFIQRAKTVGLTLKEVIGLGGTWPSRGVVRQGHGRLRSCDLQHAGKETEARELGAEHFINTKSKKAADGLREWDGGADIILATAPNTASMADAFPGLAADGTMVVLGVDAGEVRATPSDLVSGRRRLMGSPSGSRQDIRSNVELLGCSSCCAANYEGPPSRRRQDA